MDLSTEKGKHVSITLADLAGKVVLADHQLANDLNKLDISNVSRGIYLLSVELGGKKMVAKIFRE